MPTSKFIVICLDDHKEGERPVYVQATRRLFDPYLEAVKYVAGISKSRHPIIVPVLVEVADQIWPDPWPPEEGKK